MNLHIVCTVLTWVMIIPEAFCQTDKNCSCILTGLTDTTAKFIFFGLAAYSSVTTILLITCGCCLCCRLSKIKPEEGRHRQQSWHSEENGRDYRRTETISLDPTTDTESLSEVTSTFSNSSPNQFKFLLPTAALAVPMPTVPEDYGKLTEQEVSQIPEPDSASGSPEHDVKVTPEMGIKATSTSSLLAGDEMAQEKQNPGENTYANASMIEENECVTEQSKNSVYETPELENGTRHNSMDSISYERISFIRRSSSVHDYQYVDRTPNVLDVVPELDSTATLDSIEEETEQKGSDMHYAGLKDDTSGSFYESLQTDQENKGECKTKQESKKGFYQCLAPIPTGKYTKLTKENQDELSAVMRRKNVNSDTDESEVLESNAEHDEKHDSREYIYPPDYLVLIGSESDSTYEKPKPEAPIRYVNAEKAPNFMACIKELKQNSSSY